MKGLKERSSLIVDGMVGSLLLRFSYTVNYISQTNSSDLIPTARQHMQSMDLSMLRCDNHYNLIVGYQYQKVFDECVRCQAIMIMASHQDIFQPI